MAPQLSQQSQQSSLCPPHSACSQDLQRKRLSLSQDHQQAPHTPTRLPQQPLLLPQHHAYQHQQQQQMLSVHLEQGEGSLLTTAEHGPSMASLEHNSFATLQLVSAHMMDTMQHALSPGMPHPGQALDSNASSLHLQDCSTASINQSYLGSEVSEQLVVRARHHSHDGILLGCSKEHEQATAGPAPQPCAALLLAPDAVPTHMAPLLEVEEQLSSLCSSPRYSPGLEDAPGGAALPLLQSQEIFQCTWGPVDGAHADRHDRTRP